MVYVEKSLKWKYLQVVRNLESEKPLDASELNTLGDDGWELAGVAQHPPFAYYYFKRPAVSKWLTT